MALSVADTAAADVPRRAIAAWEAFCRSWSPVLVIIAAWAVLTVPLMFFRGFNSDEGVAVTIARSALEDGHWLTPHMFDLRFVERPTLLSWIIAAISYPFGHVSQLTARLPIVLFLLLGCLLIYAFLRRAKSSIPAALAAVAVFLACPMVLRSYAMATADMPLAVLLFAAFIMWWSGYSDHGLGLGRWIAIGIVLALAALMKGPQPIAYFAFGVGLFVLRFREWRQIPGLILAGVICVVPLVGWYAHVYTPGDEANWASFMRFHPATSLTGPALEVLRLITELLPAVLLGAAFVYVRGWPQVERRAVEALAYFAFAAALIILVWPGGSTARYFFPMVLPLCVLGSLGYDRLADKRPEILAPILVVTVGLLAYGFVYAVVAAPLMPQRFRSASLEAARITKTVEAAPAPIYRLGVTALNVMPYVRGRIHSTGFAELEKLKGPAWLVLPIAPAQRLMAERPGVLHQVVTQSGPDDWMLLRLEP